MKNIPAFPVPGFEWVDHYTDQWSQPREKHCYIPPQPGMELRDYFAIHARDVDIGVTKTVDERAAARYRFADAMLRAREQASEKNP